MRENLRDNLGSGGRDKTSDSSSPEPSDPSGTAAVAAQPPTPAGASPASTDRMVSLRKAVLEVCTTPDVSEHVHCKSALIGHSKGKPHTLGRIAERCCVRFDFFLLFYSLTAVAFVKSRKRIIDAAGQTILHVVGIVVVVPQNPRARKIRDNFGAGNASNSSPERSDPTDTAQPATPGGGGGSPANPNRLVALRKAVMEVDIFETRARARVPLGSLCGDGRTAYALRLLFSLCD